MQRMLVVLLLCLFGIVSICLPLRSSAIDYYVSSSMGSDAANGRTPSTAWASLTKVSSQISTFQSKDRIFLCSGDQFFNQTLSINFQQQSDDLLEQMRASRGLLEKEAAFDPVSIIGDSNFCGSSTGQTMAQISPSFVLPPQILWEKSHGDVLVADLRELMVFAPAVASVAAVFIDHYKFIQARSPNLVDPGNRVGISRSQPL